MLRAVRNKVFNTSHDLIQERLPIQKAAESLWILALGAQEYCGPRTWYLTSNSSPHFSFCIFQEFDKRRDQISLHGLLIYSFRDLL